MSGTLGLLAKHYKHYLDFLVLPLLYIGYCIPQGSLVYWVTNSSLSVVQVGEVETVDNQTWYERTVHFD
ncbi:unnamed protein product [Linum trigynum]|uniref:Uncharacterized protein n=1 Tax=Linum trigynum TaxID=586398 RepID=A0AAV2FAZ3_9ROSI